MGLGQQCNHYLSVNAIVELFIGLASRKLCIAAAGSCMFIYRVPIVVL